MAALATPARLRQRLAAAIAAVDPGARDAVLIGSAVYAPELAKDYDVVVTTETASDDRDGLWSMLVDALEKSVGNRVDVVLRQPGDRMGQLALGILAGQVVLGGGLTVAEARSFYEEAGGVAHSFDEAESCIRVADRNWQLAASEQLAQDRRRLQMVAFDELFHAARIAALCHLGRDDDRWGGVDRALPKPFGTEFKQMIAVLHMRYGYEGTIPTDREANEYQSWRQRVVAFVAHFRELTESR